MKRAEIEADQMPGQDSFLDVITNIVGILILLVLVVGLRSSKAGATSVKADDAAAVAQKAADERDMRAAVTAAATAERDVRNLIQRTVSSGEEASLLEQERLVLNTVIAGAETEIAARREKLNAEDQRDFDLRRQLKEAQFELDELARQQIALASAGKAVEAIECEPTPIGRVVTGTQVHVQLCDDRLAIIPFNELLDMMKEDARANIWRLRQEDELERTVGPVDGFRLRYWFVKSAVLARSDSGAVMAGSVSRFSHCYFQPLTIPTGEPAEEALQPNSEFGRFLQQQRPETTVTVWVYPNNYDRLRELKRMIREYGLQVAVRPLPHGVPIGASQHGSESISE